MPDEVPERPHHGLRARGRSMTTPTLTPRQLEACALYAQGLKIGEVAERMGISKQTAREHLDKAAGRMSAKHLGQLMFKLGQEAS